MQAAQAPLSSWHWKVEPGSDEENENDAEALVLVPLGPQPIVVSGAVVSGSGGRLTVQAQLAGLVSVLPAGSVARTAKLCGPLPSPV